MRKRIFGTTGREVAIVGQGTCPAPSVKSLRHGLQLGMTHIDTAEMYEDGRSEEIVGEAIRGFPREELFLVSKVMPENATKSRLARACDASLKRLGVNELDCYLLHWRGYVDLGETMSGLERLVTAGKVRAIGVSNLDPWDLRETQAAMTSEPIACNQILYNLLERTPEEHEIPWTQANGAAFVAYTPLGGLVKFGNALQEIGMRYGVSASTIALAFLLRYPNAFVIPKAATEAHIEQNARAGTLLLSAEDTESIERLVPKHQRVGPLPMN
jgi:diketogulonate reductase-like aldo/keto reductase